MGEDRNPFEGLVITKFFHKKEGRFYVSYLQDGKRKTTSYARYTYQSEHKTTLKRSDHVDHIDGDKLNDSLNNLQVLSQKDNNIKSVKERNISRLMARLICPNCSIPFIRRKSQTHLSKKGTFTSCSRTCSGTIRRKLQEGLTVDFSSNVIEIYSQLSSQNKNSSKTFESLP